MSRAIPQPDFGNVFLGADIPMLIERKPYMQTLRDFKDEHIIKVISGVRRCGKSTLLEMFADELQQTVSEGQIQFYNFEDLDVLSIGDYKQLYDHIKVKIIPGKMSHRPPA
ncbi:hypothetical protein AGMMS50230_07370 [Spirochaetia bacterium]|nr:hypothetical protein AGMMS50230_07370 [Spirochaetia bacterium]